MNQRPIRTIFDLAEYFGLRIEYRDDLPANNGGYLDPHDEPQYIAVNRNLPHCEQMFTVAHEICHYVSQHNRTRRKYRNRLLDHQYKSRRAKILIRYMRYLTNRILSIETEANMFGMSALVQIGPATDLKAYLERHPEKIWSCLFIVMDCLVKMPFRFIKRIFENLLLARTRS